MVVNSTVKGIQRYLVELYLTILSISYNHELLKEMVFVYRKFNSQSKIIFKDSFFWQSEVFHSTSLFDSQGSLHKKVRTLQKKTLLLQYHI